VKTSSLYGHRPLPPGFTLDVYRFDQVLGNPGTFGITYYAQIRGSGKRVAIKELFPADLAVRQGTEKVSVESQSQWVLFDSALQMFRREAEILSQVRHPNIVKVIDYLEANGTGYMVMEYESGHDLRVHLDQQRPGRPNENELRRLLFPLLDGLEAVHALNYLHRDIKPSNIYITRTHRPLLLDFGAARQNVVRHTRPVEQVLTPPYAPFEQYGQSLPQGPYTDIYALGVVMFTAMLPNERFPTAPDRLSRDRFVPLAQRLRGQEYSREFLEAIDWALQFRADARPQNIAEWRVALSLGSAKQRKGVPKLAGSKWFRIAAVLVAVALLTFLFYQILSRLLPS
jgi:serine/threonine protein kinase